MGEAQQSQASPSIEDFGGQRYENNYGGRYSEDNDPDLSKLKFRRRIMGMGDKSGAVRRYHRRLGVGVCGRVSANSHCNTMNRIKMFKSTFPLSKQSVLATFCLLIGMLEPHVGHSLYITLHSHYKSLVWCWKCQFCNRLFSICITLIGVCPKWTKGQ